MAYTNDTSLTTCLVCGKPIIGPVYRFADDPTSAFCSFECQLERTEVEVFEAELGPVTSPPSRPVYCGPVAEHLWFDRYCECSEQYENQFIIQKRQSVILLCPRCGCVTQD